jgi:hypothetical protein
MKCHLKFTLQLCLLYSLNATCRAAVPAAPVLPATVLSSTSSEFGCSQGSSSATDSADSLPDAPQTSAATNASSASQSAPASAGPQQTKRILFVIPNFRSVSADQKLPPTTTPEKFKIALQDSFDYSAFLEVGILAGLSEYENSEPLFHQGAAGYGRYYWHSFADNTDGDFMTEFIVPTLTKEDPRYYTLGHRGIVRRTGYSVSRLFITRNNQGSPTPNFSEIVGNGAAAGISGLYYPSNERGWTKTGQRWVLQVGIDGLSNLVKEFWPDVNDRLFHDKY